MSDFSEMLFYLRKKNNYTQQYIADNLNINQKTYSNYELGTREPDIQTIIDISNFFNISLDILLGKYKINDKLNSDIVTTTRSKKTRKPRTARNQIVSDNAFHNSD